MDSGRAGAGDGRRPESRGGGRAGRGCRPGARPRAGPGSFAVRAGAASRIRRPIFRRGAGPAHSTPPSGAPRLRARAGARVTDPARFRWRVASASAPEARLSTASLAARARRGERAPWEPKWSCGAGAGAPTTAAALRRGENARDGIGWALSSGRAVGPAERSGPAERAAGGRREKEGGGARVPPIKIEGLRRRPDGSDSGGSRDRAHLVRCPAPEARPLLRTVTSTRTPGGSPNLSVRTPCTGGGGDRVALLPRGLCASLQQ